MLTRSHFELGGGTLQPNVHAQQSVLYAEEMKQLTIVMVTLFSLHSTFLLDIK